MTEKLQPEAVYRSHSGLDGALSHSAETRSVHIMNRKDKYKFCAEPAPDVGVAKEGGMSIGFNFLNFGGNEEDESKNMTTDTPLTGRTGYVLLARELGYRLCESASNYKMNFEQFRKIYELNIATLEEVGLIEASNSSYDFGTETKETFNIGMGSSMKMGASAGGSYDDDGGGGAAKDLTKIKTDAECKKYNDTHPIGDRTTVGESGTIQNYKWDGSKCKRHLHSFLTKNECEGAGFTWAYTNDSAKWDDFDDDSHSPCYKQ